MYLIYDIQEPSNSFEMTDLDQARSFLLNLWEELDEHHLFLKKIENANFNEIKEMLEGSDYSIIYFKKHKNFITFSFISNEVSYETCNKIAKGYLSENKIKYDSMYSQHNFQLHVTYFDIVVKLTV